MSDLDAALAAAQAEAKADLDAAEVVPTRGLLRVDVDIGDGPRRGEFAYEIPVTVRANRELGLLIGQIAGNRGLTGRDQAFAEMLAYVMVVVKDAPDWMKPGGRIDWSDQPDVLVMRIFEEVRKHEARFREGCRVGVEPA